jgi:hypothetical protein
METTPGSTWTATDYTVEVSPDGQVADVATSPLMRMWLWQPNLIVFLDR